MLWIAVAVVAFIVYRQRRQPPPAGDSPATVGVVLPHQVQALPPMPDLPPFIVPWISKLPFQWQLAVYVLAWIVEHKIANRAPVLPAPPPPAAA